jgi:hypothetical protein
MPMTARLPSVFASAARWPPADQVARIRTGAQRLLPVWFGVISVLVANATIAGDGIGLDTKIYRLAAMEALSGGDPWTAQYGPFLFGAPPPTVIAAMPLAFLPEQLAVVAWATVLLAAAYATVRLLRLPVWWMMFPPVVDSVVVGNPDVLIIALLAAGSWVARGVAPLFKVYAMVPLLILGHWRSLLLAGGLLALSLPLWLTYLPKAGTVAQTLSAQSLGGYSAFGTVLLIPTIAALVVVERRTSGWLVVPAIWPYTQFHYSCIAMPVLGLASAYLMAVPIRGLPAITVIVIALHSLWRALVDDGSTDALSPLGRAITGWWRGRRPPLSDRSSSLPRMR